MPGFLYYLPDLGKPATREDAAKAGLGYAFEKARSFAQCGCNSGPDKRPGHVVADATSLTDRRVGYYPDKQTWHRIPRFVSESGVWVGYYTDAPPTPADLARPRQLQGHLVELADGNKWLIPVARAFEITGDDIRPVISLPQRLTLDDEGQWTESAIEARWQYLWDIGQGWLDTVMGVAPGGDADGESVDGKVIDLTIAGLADSAVSILQANYRVSAAEVSMLGLLNRDVLAHVLNAVIDMPTFAAWQSKKAEAAGSPGDAGPAASTPDTDPPSPTSSN